MPMREMLQRDMERHLRERLHGRDSDDDYSNEEYVTTDDDEDMDEPLREDDGELLGSGFSRVTKREVLEGALKRFQKERGIRDDSDDASDDENRSPDTSDGGDILSDSRRLELQHTLERKAMEEYTKNQLFGFGHERTNDDKNWKTFGKNKKKRSTSGEKSADDYLKQGLDYYLGENGRPLDYPKAKELFLKAADLGNTDALNYLGLIYDNGFGVTKDIRRPGSGNMYKRGDGAARDYSKAIELFKKPAVQEYGPAMSALGMMYRDGLSVTQDYTIAVQLFHMAILAKDVAAMNSLGLMHQNGRGVPQSWTNAARFYELGAKKGCPNAKANLGFLYRAGFGVPQDYAKALELLREAANGGNGNGQNHLAYMYQYGYGIPQDYSKAAELYQKAAEYGHADALVNLAVLYENSYGVPRNMSMATVLYAEAVERGGDMMKRVIIEARKNAAKSNK
ncbi:hypothetical protein BGX21_008373 [Mortierella sp. AD011]|nr:hypothetical protein BGX20_008973 [Mortierella sp. AD010]KAF9402863.1 hypothetical protein BGX21_008373 [Mortierella sp. AD011]